MLRITVQDEPDQVTLKLEGNLDGIWVTELEDSWRTAQLKIRRPFAPPGFSGS